MSEPSPIYPTRPYVCGIYTGPAHFAIAALPLDCDIPVRAATGPTLSAARGPSARLARYHRIVARTADLLAACGAPVLIALSPYPHGRRRNVVAAIELGALLRADFYCRGWRMIEVPWDLIRPYVPALRPPAGGPAPAADGPSPAGPVPPARLALARALALARFAQGASRPAAARPAVQAARLAALARPGFRD